VRSAKGTGDPPRPPPVVHELMAIAALGGLALFALVAFVWRAWLQYRRTGDTGLRASSRTAREVASGSLLALGVVAIVLGPVMDLAGVLSRVDALTGAAFRATGVALFVFGFALTVVAQLKMGRSWRVGVDRSEKTDLVTGGVFRYVRNPIFSAMTAAFAGVALLVPNLLTISGALLVFLGLELHVRLVEEPYLRRTHGEQYLGYARTAGRFVPGLGRLGA
jgi:protein-S-isoprenylcysteine O-methyltransferase Ste14